MFWPVAVLVLSLDTDGICRPCWPYRHRLTAHTNGGLPTCVTNECFCHKNRSRNINKEPPNAGRTPFLPKMEGHRLKYQVALMCHLQTDRYVPHHHLYSQRFQFRL